MTAPVLLVEDDLALAQALTMTIEKLGIPVEACVTGEGAVELLAAKVYALVIVDLVLSVGGGISGAYVVNAVRKMPPAERPAVILITSGTVSLRGVDRSVVSVVLFKPLKFDLFARYVETTYRIALERDTVPRHDDSSRIHTFCGSCGSSIAAWMSDRTSPPRPDAFEAWVDTPCAGCGTTPRVSGGRSEM